MLKDYGTDVQKLFLEMMLHDAEAFVRVQNIYNSENFDRTLRPVAEFIKKHSNDYKTLPTREQIKAATGVALQEIPDLNEGHGEWFMQEFESFTKRQELERAILKMKLQEGQLQYAKKTAENDLLMITTQLECLKTQINLLEVIKDDKSIPNETKN